MDEKSTESTEAAEPRTSYMSVNLSALDRAETASIAYSEPDAALAGFPSAKLVAELSARSESHEVLDGVRRDGNPYQSLGIYVEL